MSKEKYEKQKSIDAKLIWVIFGVLLCFGFLAKLSADHKDKTKQQQKYYTEIENYIRQCKPSLYVLSTTPEGINIKVSAQQGNKTVSATMFIENGDEYEGMIKSEIDEIKEIINVQ